MKKKYWAALMLLCSLVFLVGWGKKKVELLNDKKLIDLNAAIERCIPGANAPERPENEASASDDSLEETLAQAVPAEAHSVEETERIVIIKVRDQTVTYDAETYTDLSKLEARIRQDNGEHVSFRLVDDFAEAHVYKEVLSILGDLEAEIGLNCTKE